MTWDSLSKAWSALEQRTNPPWDNYLGFYSSWLGGYFREPWAMMVPMDDHGFHRGDGVFEAARIHQRAYIDLDAHLQRLEVSAAAIAMKLPAPLEEIKSICLRLAQLCDAETAILRLYVTRGPGGFSPSPAEVVGAQIYAALTKLKPLSPETYARGVTAMWSTVPAKEARFARVKSCNYLQNVLMKKECLDRGVDFAISVDEHGRVCEGSTENLLIVSREGEVLVPRFDYTLRGTTVQVAMSIAETLKASGEVKDVRLADLTRDQVMQAREVAFVGTTLGVLPVREIDGQAIAEGRPGPITLHLNQNLMQRMASDPGLRTEF